MLSQRKHLHIFAPFIYDAKLANALTFFIIIAIKIKVIFSLRSRCVLNQNLWYQYFSWNGMYTILLIVDIIMLVIERCKRNRSYRSIYVKATQICAHFFFCTDNDSNLLCPDRMSHHVSNVILHWVFSSTFFSSSFFHFFFYEFLDFFGELSFFPFNVSKKKKTVFFH